jgi:hypothetical protein
VAVSSSNEKRRATEPSFKTAHLVSLIQEYKSKVQFTLFYKLTNAHFSQLQMFCSYFYFFSWSDGKRPNRGNLLT